MRRTYERGAVLLILLVATASAARAERLVLFEDGRTLAVRTAVRDGDRAWLEMSGGGKLAVPADLVRNWDELAKPLPPEPPPAEVPTPPRHHADALWRSAAGSYADLIADAADRHGLDPALLTAMAQAESAFDPRAVSPKGAGGLLQLMPATAERFGVADVFDAPQNVEGAAKYFRWLLERFEGRTDLALAGYNAGEGTVDRYQGIPPYRETRDYVTRVLDGARRLARLAP
jgi:soluble lytic murein transglycosylase-like protein